MARLLSGGLRCGERVDSDRWSVRNCKGDPKTRKSPMMAVKFLNVEVVTLRKAQEQHRVLTRIEVNGKNYKLRLKIGQVVFYVEKSRPRWEGQRHPVLVAFRESGPGFP